MSLSLETAGAERRQREREEAAEKAFKEILEAIDRPRRRSDPPGKTILLELWGPGKVGKTRLAIKLRQFFTRYGARVMLLPEGAELEDIRGMSEDDAAAFQELHIAHVLENVLKFSESRVFHMVIVDRGLLDMRGWLHRWVLKGKMSEETRQHYDRVVLNSAALKRMDAFYYLAAAPEVSWARETTGSLTYREGRKMSPASLKQMGDIWEGIYNDTRERFPDIPLLKVDTSHNDIERSGWEILEHLLGSFRNKLEKEAR